MSPVVPINLPREVDDQLDWLLQIADVSSDDHLMTREDIIAISLKMYHLSFDRDYRDLPALIVFGLARKAWFDHKAQGGNHVADDHR